MNKVLLAIATLAASAAFATTHPQAAPAAPAASAAQVRGCERVEVTTRTVNGKAVEVRRKVRDRNPDCPKPAAVKLWD